MNYLPDHKFKTKAICGLTKNELFEKFVSSVHNYRIKSAIEATTYIHYSGYHVEWWDTVFNLILKNIHINLYGHFMTIAKYYDYYQQKKQHGTMVNNESVVMDQNIGWHMCQITTMLTVLDKSSILTPIQVRSMPFFQFIVREGTSRPKKLRVIHDNMMNCIEDAITTNDADELIQLIHYVLREDYGHNKYVPILFDKFLENASYHKVQELSAIKGLYPQVRGNKRYLTMLVFALVYYQENLDKMELGRFEQQARYYYGRNLEKIQKYYQRNQNKTKQFREVQYESPTVDNLRHETFTQQLLPTEQDNTFVPPRMEHPATLPQSPSTHREKTASTPLNDIESFIFEPLEEPSEDVNDLSQAMDQLDWNDNYLETASLPEQQPIEPEQQPIEPEQPTVAELVPHGRKHKIRILKM